MPGADQLLALAFFTLALLLASVATADSLADRRRR